MECIGAQRATGNGQRVGKMRDDTGFAKQGTHSVGVSWQYSGTWGKVGNCQVAVTSVYADPAVSWPVQVQLYLPKEWTDDPLRCAQAGVPEDLTIQTRPEIALDMLEEADRRQLPLEEIHRRVVKTLWNMVVEYCIQRRIADRNQPVRI